MTSLQIRHYSSTDDLRRDLTTLSTEFCDSIKRLESFEQILSQAGEVLAVRIRGGGDKQDGGPHLETLPQRGLQVTKIHRNFQSLQDLEDQKQILDNMILQLKHEFHGDKTADKMVKEAEALQEGISKRLRDAYKTAGEIAAKEIPGQFKTWVTRIKNQLMEMFEKRYRDVRDTRYIIAPTDKGMLYAGYIKFLDLRSDDNHLYSEYYVVLCMRVSPDGRLGYMIGLDTKFKLPNKMDWDGRGTTLEDMRKILMRQLSIDHFVSKIEPRPVPISPDKLNFKRDMVENVSIKDDVITVEIKRRGSKQSVEEAVALLQGDLKAIIMRERPSNKDTITRHIYTKGGATFVDFKFVIPPGYKGLTLQKPQWQQLKEHGFSDEDLRHLQEWLDDSGKRHIKGLRPGKDDD